VTVEVIGVDHVYVTVSDLRCSEEFYDRAMGVLGFRKGRSPIGGDPHVHYYNRQYGYSLRPAREGAPDHDPYAPGLHHFCFRVIDEVAVNRAARELGEAGVEVTNFREKRRRLMYDWEAREDL
jgi:catechol 2,3-dioxygenase-like lactoylglutathione lyase family enzyme